MNPTIKNILAVLAGIFVGGIVNMGLIAITGYMAPIPEGVDPNDIESVQANIHRYSVVNLMHIIVAHFMGTLIGAFTAAKLGVSKQLTLSLIVGIFFLIGGIYMVYLIPEAPMWMKATDLIVAYIPMGWLGWNMAEIK